MTPLLEVQGLFAGHGQGDVVFGAQLTVDTAETIAILGPNGAGKSTVLKSIAGLVASCRGQVRFKGLELLGHGAADRARCGICFVPEGRALFPTLTVRENLRLSTARREDAWAHLLEDAHSSFPRLAERQSQPAGTLSGGEQRMLALARAMISDPLLLLLDEPSLGLAPLVVNEVYEVIEALRRRGIALVIVEQYVHRALAVADRVYVMHKGVLHEAGPARDLDAESLAASYLNQQRLVSTDTARPLPTKRRDARHDR